MTDYFGVNATKQLNQSPVELIPVGEYNGRVRVARDNIAAGIHLTTDTIKLMKLPPGAQVVEVMFKQDAADTTGIVDIGWQANDEDAADLDGFGSSLNCYTAATLVKMSDTVALTGNFKQFNVDIVAGSIYGYYNKTIVMRSSY